MEVDMIMCLPCYFIKYICSRDRVKFDSKSEREISCSYYNREDEHSMYYTLLHSW